MIVTFFGHSEFLKTEECAQRMLELLGERVGDHPAEMYLGGYGNYDDFAYECCKRYKKMHPHISLVLVTPYLTDSYQRNHLKLQEKRYDCVLYPGIEDKPKKYAITYRNRYMIEQADFVIAYISHNFGGAYTAYRYAKRKGKTVFNLAQKELKEK